jgi:hypothetical protein
MAINIDTKLAFSFVCQKPVLFSIWPLKIYQTRNKSRYKWFIISDTFDTPFYIGTVI